VLPQALPGKLITVFHKTLRLAVARKTVHAQDDWDHPPGVVDDGLPLDVAERNPVLLVPLVICLFPGAQARVEVFSTSSLARHAPVVASF
jgi:hypothetical protein